MKSLIKKWLADFLSGLGVISLCFALLSLLPEIFPRSDEHTQHYLLFLIQALRFVAVTTPIVSLIENLIMEFELFSKDKEKRQVINVIICVCVVLCIINIFGLLPEEVHGITSVVAVLFVPVGATIAYLIEKKTQKQDIIDINNKLAEMNESPKK